MCVRADGTAAVDSKTIFQGLGALLELEMEEQLGYPKYAAADLERLRSCACDTLQIRTNAS